MLYCCLPGVSGVSHHGADQTTGGGDLGHTGAHKHGEVGVNFPCVPMLQCSLGTREEAAMQKYRGIRMGVGTQLITARTAGAKLGLG